MDRKEQELRLKKEQFEFDALEVKAKILRLEVQQEDNNLRKIVEIGVLKDFLLYIKKYRAMFTVQQAEEFRQIDNRMKGIITIQDGQVKINEEILDEFIAEIEDQINPTEDGGIA
ncbi:hypothetical protein [Bacillus atrophaeus]|uniref:hypothetical protein n=1 Tax=Bacillus atrophaeus TaxID=1452 RepID=UPI003872AAE5